MPESLISSNNVKQIRVFTYSFCFASFICSLLPLRGWSPNMEMRLMYPTPLTPPGWTYQVWAVIYVSQGAMFFVLLRQLKAPYDDELEARYMLQWLSVWWVSVCIWRSVVDLLPPPLGPTLCAPFAILGAYACTQALHTCDHLPWGDWQSRVNTFVKVTAASISAAWMVFASSVAVLTALAAISWNIALAPGAVLLTVSMTACSFFPTVRRSSAAYSLTLMWAYSGVHLGDQAGKLVNTLAVGSIVLLASLSFAVIIVAVTSSVNAEPDSDSDDEPVIWEPLLQL